MKPPPVRRYFFLSMLLAASASASDVKSLGARGDGQTDDTAAIQRAVDAGGRIEFPTGTYRLTRTIRIALAKTGFVSLVADGTARVVMAGAGPAFEFTGSITGSAAPAQIKPDVWQRERMPRVDGLEIVGAHAEADGIAATGTMQLGITRVLIREARHAIRLHHRNRNVLIADSHLYHNRGIGIFYDHVDLHQTNITGTHISYNSGGGIVVRGGHVRNLHIGTCDLEANVDENGPPTANILLDSTGGSTGEVTITGCTLQHAPAPGSANIRILGRGLRTRTDKTPTTEGQVTIVGNMINDTEVNLHLQSVRGVTITGNSLGTAVLHDVLIEDSSNVVLGPNTIDRNPRYPSSNVRQGGVVIRRSRDGALNGLIVNQVLRQPAAVLLEDCERFNVSGISILDSDGIGLALHRCTLTHVTGALIRDGREKQNPATSLEVTGGRGNTIVNNILDRAPQIGADAALARGNEIVK